MTSAKMWSEEPAKVCSQQLAFSIVFTSANQVEDTVSCCFKLKLLLGVLFDGCCHPVQCMLSG